MLEAPLKNAAFLLCGVIEQRPGHHVIAVELSCPSRQSVGHGKLAEMETHRIQTKSVCPLRQPADEIQIVLIARFPERLPVKRYREGDDGVFLDEVGLNP